MSRTAGRTHVTYSCSGMERLVPSSWSSPAPEIFVHFSPGAARHSRSAGGRHGFTAAQANGSHPELYKLHCSKLSRGGRLAGRPRPWRQTNASVDERHCRQSSHCQIARATTRPLPPQRYEFAEWRKAKVNLDYHVEVDRNYYSVPYPLVGETVDIRLTDGLVEILHRGKRVACHPRATGRGRSVTQIQHMPASHRRHREWTPSKLRRWAESVGPHTAQLVVTILEEKPHPEQGFRSCLGIIHLARKYGSDRLEAAAARACAARTFSYSSVKSILAHNLDQAPLPGPPDNQATPVHPNLRGPDYYAGGGP